MAVGDVVNGVVASPTITISFQPASGVECCITSAHGGNGSYLYTAITDGVNTATSRVAFTTYWATNADNIKMMINNTNYCVINSGGNGCSYTGIQIK